MPKVSGARVSDAAEINKLTAHQTTAPQCSSPQPLAPNLDTQLDYIDFLCREKEENLILSISFKFTYRRTLGRLNSTAL
ncbi:hypothetical protein [Vibrio gazogenes]|uniref:hypothetical protein n=1 Tax=Vibrio gazogenes TaxID=687 RepID=UPI0010420CFF|nr:hypothetical protein [Vibrio gazogenes]USP16190.1 hypothetical protein MKS89_17565 [Vibrio gazogenes]